MINNDWICGYHSRVKRTSFSGLDKIEFGGDFFWGGNKIPQGISLGAALQENIYCLNCALLSPFKNILPH